MTFAAGNWGKVIVIGIGMLSGINPTGPSSYESDICPTSAPELLLPNTQAPNH